jgi:glycosyltransferase involved in cell wall biosynthesis
LQVRDLAGVLRVLTFTTLYPSSARPRHGIFVETRLAHVGRCTGMQFEVVAPVPWFPFGSRRFGRYGAFARTPRDEVRNGVRVRYPRYLTLPGVGMYTQPFALAAASLGSVRDAIREGFDFDLIDAHYLYPDAVAASLLASRFGKPLVVTARGSDVNLLMKKRVPRALVLRALARADGIATVSADLRGALARHGVDPTRIRVLRNGVDTSLFRPIAKDSARRALSLGDGPVFASVGNLVPEKGHALAIAAVAQVADATLLIVGDGPERDRLASDARERGVNDRVTFLPARPQAELPTIYSAADALILASTREGWPNVVLEAIACGTPVVAAAVGGVPEIVTAHNGGIVVGERSAAAIADALARIVARPPHREDLVRYASAFGWDETAHGFAALCEEAIAAKVERVAPLASRFATGDRRPKPDRRHA